jgi:hypothetical protein
VVIIVFLCNNPRMKKTILISALTVLTSLITCPAFAQSGFDDFVKNIHELLVLPETPGVTGQDCEVVVTEGAVGTFAVSIQKVSTCETLIRFKPSAGGMGSHSASFSEFGSKFTYKLKDNGEKQKFNYSNGTVTISNNSDEVKCQLN